MVCREPSAENLSDDSFEATAVGWNLPSSFPTRPEKELHVWLIDVSRSNRQIDFEGILVAEELERAGRLRSADAAARFRASHVALRRILGGYLDCRPGHVTFELGEAGKPRLSRARDATFNLRFNLTHSGDVALCAVGGCGEVGVDVEDVRPLRDVDRLAARHFSPDELAGWTALEPSQRLDEFYRVWTRKEALLKAAGLGLSRPLERVDTLGGVLDDVSYWLTDLEMSASFRAAIACVDRPLALRCWRWKDSLAPTDGS